MIGRDGSPFDCEKCSDKDKELRNCFNRLGLSEAARAVTEYTGAVVEELKNPPLSMTIVNPSLKPPFEKGGGKGKGFVRSQETSERGRKDSATRGKGGVARRVAQRPAQKVFSLGDIRLYECPVSYISSDTVEIMRLVFLVDDRGSLLYGGGWGDQPAWLVEAVEIFRMENVRRSKEREEG